MRGGDREGGSKCLHIGRTRVGTTVVSEREAEEGGGRKGWLVGATRIEVYSHLQE